MRPVFMFLALVALAFVGLLGLVLLSPSGPTGFAIAPPTDLAGNTLIRAQQLDSPLGLPPIRITVEGDLVWRTLLIDGAPETLSGIPVDDDWVKGPATLVTRLPPGEHVIHAYSCVETSFGYQCGCLNPDNCGNWMQRSVDVK